MEISGRDYRSGEAVTLVVRNRHVSERRRYGGPVTIDSLPWIAPGLVDLQSNGHGGQEFSSPQLTVERVERIAKQQATFGVTQFLPTITTAARTTLERACRVIADAVEQSSEVAAVVAGIHLEGPYISPEDGPRGAHPLQHCRPPDWSEFQSLQDAAGGRIRIVTLSPEYAEAPDFIRRVVDSGAIVAIGHTSATSDQIRAAVEAGATMCTHLGNGCHRQLRRHPNYIWDQLADDGLIASLVVDGHHLPPEVVKVFVRAKSPERIVMVSDLSGMAGLSPGRYQSELCELDIMPDGRLVVAGQDQLLAAASRPLAVGIGLMTRFAGVSLEQAIRMAANQPAAIIGCRCGGLDVDDNANLVLLRRDESSAQNPIQVIGTINQGTVAYTIPASGLFSRS